MPEKEKINGNQCDHAPEVNQAEVDEILVKYDKESAFRRLVGWQGKLVYGLAVTFTLFQLYTAIFGVLPAQLQRPIHLGFALVLVFLLYPATSKGNKREFGIIDVVTAGMAAFVAGYLVVNYEPLIFRAGNFTLLDKGVGLVGILLVLEAGRRVVGIPIVTIASAFLLYAYFGDMIPGFLSHRGYSIDRIISHMYYTTEGIMGTPLGVSSTFIFLFLLFGAFLEKTGIGKLFIDVANALAGWAAGGPAKVAVICSAMQGTVSGSSVANTVGTGSFTIPMMKKLGYRPEFAGAVEAAASTGGQLMPPIMGAAAFLMAEFTGVPYIEIAKAATVPALLYFTGVFIMVHLEAKRLGLKGMCREELPSVVAVLKDRGHLFLPLFGIIYVLVQGATPLRAALIGIVLSLLASVVKQSTRLSFKDFIDALEQGARSALGVAVACACAGIIVGTVTLTGVGLKMATGLIALAGGVMLLTLFFTMIASLILGMGAPTTANYIITSTIAAPALITMGIPVLAAHMFTFYFGIVADITPPVALAAYAGSGIAKSDPIKTGINASRLAIAAFIIPYIFVYSPGLLLIDATVGTMIHNTLTAVTGMIGIGIGMIGYFLVTLRPWERIIAVAGGMMLIVPGILTDGLGTVIVGALLFKQWRERQQTNNQMNETI